MDFPQLCHDTFYWMLQNPHLLHPTFILHKSLHKKNMNKFIFDIFDFHESNMVAGYFFNE